MTFDIPLGVPILDVANGVGTFDATFEAALDAASGVLILEADPHAEAEGVLGTAAGVTGARSTGGGCGVLTLGVAAGVTAFDTAAGVATLEAGAGVAILEAGAGVVILEAGAGVASFDATDMEGCT